MKDKEKEVVEKKRSKSKNVEEYQRDDQISSQEQDLSESSGSSSESEDDENAALVTAETEAEVLRTVALLRAKDPRIYQKEVEFYDDSKLEKAEKVWKSSLDSVKDGTKKKKDPLTLRGIYQKNILIGNATEEELVQETTFKNSNNEDIFDEYSFKNEFKNAFSGSGRNDKETGSEDEEGDLLVLKEKSTDTLEREDREYKEFLFQSLSADTVTSQTANDWFSLKDDMNEDDKFLINYVLNRGWIEKTASNKKQSEPVSLEDDEQDLEKTDQFEFNHNFRFEAGTEAIKIPSFPRVIEDSVRTSTNSKRKRQREAKKLRQQEEKEALGDQFKKEKNTLKKELRMKQLEEELDKELEEEFEEKYFQKSFEDVIEGMPTRYKYVNVQKTSFGLSTEDILMADDELLSKHAPSKCYAPFITPEEHNELEEKYGSKKRIYKFRDLLKRSLECEEQNDRNHEE